MLSGKEEDTRSVCAAAVLAAEQAQKNVSAISIGKEPLALRIGLHVGLVLSGDFGSATRHQFTLIGPEVNKAARLEQVHADDIIEGNAPLGSVRISSEFRNELNELQRQKFRNRFVVEAKNIGSAEVFTN